MANLYSLDTQEERRKITTVEDNTGNADIVW